MSRAQRPWKGIGDGLRLADDTERDSEGASATRVPLGAVEFAERLLRWVTAEAYHTPIDDFATGLGAVWLSFCFDHDLNPFSELHGILERFPLAEALGTTVPPWAKAKAETRECENCGQQKPIEEMSTVFLPGTGESLQCEACRG